ncbi:MAG: hypothetical protein NC905_02980 [Candidatus Omnitrophica bacterium]|nr:hypothetical protein [Candidatus Omnitrophota bacterium]
MWKFENYRILKANLHCHYAQMHLGNPLPVIATYRKAGFDCIALTEHANQTDTSVERNISEKITKRCGNSFFVIVGKENTARTSIRGVALTNDIVSLFIKDDVSSYDEYGNVRPHREQIEEIHKKGGIAIIAHEHSSQPSKEPSKRLWTYRKCFDIDGWEIGHGLGLLEYGDGKNTSLHREPKKVIEEGYIAVSSADSHTDFQAYSPGEATYTYIFTKELSMEGIKNALMNRQTVAIVHGYPYGKKRWQDVYKEWKAKEYKKLKEKKIDSDKKITARKLFYLSNNEKIEFVKKLKRYYQTVNISHQYYISEKNIISLFFAISDTTEQLKQILQEADCWLSYRYYWILEYQFQEKQRKQIHYLLKSPDEKNPEYWGKIARCYYLAQEHKKALQYYRKAEKMGADTDDFYIGYCQVLFRDDPVKTLSLCIKGLQKYPDNLYLKAQGRIMEKLVRNVRNKV